MLARWHKVLNRGHSQRCGRAEWFRERRGSMLGGDETTDDPVIADARNFYKVELWTRDDYIEQMLFGGMSLDKAHGI